MKTYWDVDAQLPHS